MFGMMSLLTCSAFSILCCFAAPDEDKPRLKVSGGGPQRPLSPAEVAERQVLLQKCQDLAEAGFRSLISEKYEAAEVCAREGLRLAHGHDEISTQILAQALAGQGKCDEAQEVYGRLVDNGEWRRHILLPYALLLLDSEQEVEALRVYEKALAKMSEGELIRKEWDFSERSITPKELSAAIHLALGITYLLHNRDMAYTRTATPTLPTALGYLRKAIELAPQSAVVNLYYAKGLQQEGKAAEAKTRYAEAAALTRDPELKKILDIPPHLS